MEFWLRVSGWVFLGLCLVTATVLGLGGRIPEQEMSVVSGEVGAPPAEVWAALADVEDAPRWQTGLLAVSPLPARQGLPCWRERRRFSSLPLCVTEERQPTWRVVRVVDPKSPLKETWSYTLRPVAGGTAVQIAEDARVEPAMWRFARRYLLKSNDGPEQRLNDLRRRVANPAR